MHSSAIGPGGSEVRIWLLIGCSQSDEMWAGETRFECLNSSSAHITPQRWPDSRQELAQLVVGNKNVLTREKEPCSRSHVSARSCSAGTGMIERALLWHICARFTLNPFAANQHFMENPRCFINCFYIISPKNAVKDKKKIKWVLRQSLEFKWEKKSDNF